MLKLWLAALAVALALAPLAQAAEANGRIEAKALTLEPSTLSADAIGLRWAQSGVPDVQLQAAHVTVERIGSRTTSLDVAGRTFNNGASPIDDTTQHNSSSLKLRAGDGVQMLGLKGVGLATGSIGAATARPVGGALLAYGDNNAQNAMGKESCAQSAQPMCVDVFSAYELATSAAQMQIADADLTFLVKGPAVLVDEAGKTTEYDSGSTTSTSGALTTSDDAWVLVHATGVSGTLASSAPASWFATQPVLSAPAASFDDATGALHVGALSYHASAQPVSAAGALQLALESVPAGPHVDAATSAPTVYATSFGAQVHGDVQSVNLAATPVFVDSPAQSAGLLAVLAAVGAGVAYAWPHLSFAAASLYTRLQKPDILDNGVRNSIYEIIRTHPGISAREVHRQSGQSWGTVVYHLRQLERHHLVVSRALGRTRNYYENHGKYKGMEVQLACLQSERARVLARAIVAQPGITQEQLAAATGFPQPTTSYYVRKLKQAGLVEEQRDGRYAKYVPLGEVARFVELASATPQVGANAPSGVAQ